MAEIARIRDSLSFFGGAIGNCRQLYEERMVPMDAAQPGGGLRSEELSPDKWRYYVVEPPQEATVTSSGQRIPDYFQHILDQAGRLSKVELRFAVTLYPKSQGFHGYPVASLLGWETFTRFEDILDDAAVNEIREGFKSLQDIAGQFPRITRASEKFLHLRGVAGSDLYPLGLFAIIESLLTHDPHGRYDSLRHQIASKIPLLEKRMAMKLDYSVFRNPTPQEIWQALYSYRSTIAHGDDANFALAELRILVNRGRVEQFLTQALKSLIRHAMREPELVTDLQKV
ncbi:MAG: hypothetical protein ABR964_11630 [Tepidisphaeraceae bacterium]|jgi:hypothetical protein